MSSPPRSSTLGVKSLRAQFERTASSRKALTPEQFLKEQKLAAEQEANAILLARKKAAAFNMAMRQLELKQAVETKMTPQQEETRAKLRKEARRLSVALRTMDNASEENRPEMQKQERRATHLLLASMATELEEEMRKEELDAIREEEEAKERLAAALAQEEEDEAERKKREEAMQMAHEMAELARKQVQEDERQRKQEEEARQRKQEAEEMKRLESMRIQQLEEKDRQVLTTYLRENYPEKLGEVEVLLKQFAGNLDVLFEELGKDQKFKEVAANATNNSSIIDENLEVADDDSDDDDEDVGMNAVSRMSRSAHSEGAETTVHTLRDDETIAPRPKNDKSFLKPGVDLRDVITRFYSIYAASKLKDIDDILKHFDNREADLFRTLEVKYDVTFNTDGACVPNNGDRVGEPFIEASNSFPSAANNGGSSKFAVDVQTRTLKERLTKQGQSQDTVNVILSSGSGMM